MFNARCRDAIDVRQRRPAGRVEDESSLYEETRMASSRPISAEAAWLGAAGSPDNPPSLVVALFEAQRAQWEAMLSWHESLATCARDFWEQWAVLYTGGVPFDG